MCTTRLITPPPAEDLVLTWLVREAVQGGGTWEAYRGGRREPGGAQEAIFLTLFTTVLRVLEGSLDHVYHCSEGPGRLSGPR